MKTKFIKLVFLFALMVTITSISYGQKKGILKGVVSEKSTGSTLPGATIIIAGTNNGTTTNIDGEYTLTNIPVGKSTIVFSFVSFKSDSLIIDITAGETTVADVQLSDETIGLDEVIITAQLLGQKKAISQQLHSDAIVNVVSSDKIQELPDVNAAEAIARLPGIAINRSGGEGQKIVIRGMEPKYAAITMNGVKIPSNSASDRSVDLSLISPELLNGIEVYKSPLPNMDAESSAGTVNLKLRKAPNKLYLLGKGLVGYNDLANDYGDYKGIFQASNRFFNNKLGVLAQITMERFNRSGDVLGYGWGQGGTDEETGITKIEGSSLNFTDNREIRKRWNSNVNFDYDLNKNNSLTFFGLFSRTDRDSYRYSNSYSPGGNSISYSGAATEYVLDLSMFSLSGDHTLGKVNMDWSLSTSRSQGETPYQFNISFPTVIAGGLFDPELDRYGHPRTFLDAARVNTNEIYLKNNNLYEKNTLEKTNVAFINFKVPFQFSDKIKASFEFGGRYSTIDRTRDVTQYTEPYYYLGSGATERAAEAYDGELIYIPSNSQLISFENFENKNGDVGINLEDGSYFPFPVVLDPAKTKHWSDVQKSVLNKSGYAREQNYGVAETVRAGYAMIKINFGDMLTIIPGFRYEYSDNQYEGTIVTGAGAYEGYYADTVTYQKYGEFFPHLHIKFKPFNWFDVRASYAKTIARPSFNDIKPSGFINHTNGSIRAGNPNLKHSLTTSYDLNFSFFDEKLGLFTIGGFYKDIDNVSIPRSIIMVTPEMAEENGWPEYSSYQLNSYTNLPLSKVWGYEMEVQTNLSMLPQPFSGIVLSANYARLYSETDVIFLTSETVFEGGFPPIPVTTYTENTRTVTMPSQAPEIFRASIGYDYKGFSCRVSASYQGTKGRSYNLNKDFDSYDLAFWRWDASAKQKLGKRWSLFFNLNNLSNQQDIRFTRNTNYINAIETYGSTATIGVQFKY